LRRKRLGGFDMCHAYSPLFNPLAPSLGGQDKGEYLRDTLRLPAAFRCTVIAK
jgi:hypothetical protein